MAGAGVGLGFGSGQRGLVLALALLFLLALGTRLAGMQPGLANLWLYGLHKSIGLCLLALVVISKTFVTPLFQLIPFLVVVANILLVADGPDP